MKALAILAGIAFVIAATCLARAMDRHDARRAREWDEE